MNELVTFITAKLFPKLAISFFVASSVVTSGFAGWKMHPSTTPSPTPISQVSTVTATQNQPVPTTGDTQTTPTTNQIPTSTLAPTATPPPIPVVTTATRDTSRSHTTINATRPTVTANPVTKKPREAEDEEEKEMSEAEKKLAEQQKEAAKQAQESHDED